VELKFSTDFATILEFGNGPHYALLHYITKIQMFIFLKPIEGSNIKIACGRRVNREFIADVKSLK